MAETKFSDHIYGNFDPRQESHNMAVYANQEIVTSQEDKGGKLPESVTTEVKYYRVAVVSLGLLCVLLVAGIILVAIKGTAERDQLYNNLAQEKDQLQANNTILIQEKDQLQANNTILTQDRDKLQARNTDLTQENRKLLDIISGLGWTYYGSSIYYFSSEQKSWGNSQQHCSNLGAHLVIIDSEEEQNFIYGQGRTAWIGLTDSASEGVWKWVDGKPLGRSRYWMEGEPNDQNNREDCVEIIPSEMRLKSWNDNDCTHTREYICEK